GRIELVPMSTAASRGGVGAAAGPEVGAAPPVAAGRLVWAVALAMPPDLSWGERNGAASPSASMRHRVQAYHRCVTDGQRPCLEGKPLLHGEMRRGAARRGGLPRAAGVWKHHPDRRTPARGALGLHPPAVGLHEMLHDSEPQTGTPLIPGAGGVRAVEPLEH